MRTVLTTLKVLALIGFMALLAGCDLAITKVADPDPATVGEDLTYTLEVTNNPSDPPPNPEGPGGNGTTNEVVVADRLPASVDLVSATPSQGTCEDASEENVVFCELGALELNQSETVTIVVTPQEVGRIENTATTQNCDGPSEANPGLDEEGNIVCAQEGDLPPDEAAEMLAIQEESARIEAQEVMEYCDSPTECDPQEDNTVTISTNVREVPEPDPEPEPEPTNPNACTVIGTQGKDNLVGTSGRDVICGLGGNDNIVGRGGNDVVRGGGGNDKISGNGGNDTLLGGAGNDRIAGGAGDDRLEGQAGNDSLVGGSGKDRLSGGSGNNTLVQ